VVLSIIRKLGWSSLRKDSVEGQAELRELRPEKELLYAKLLYDKLFYAKLLNAKLLYAKQLYAKM
jgi:hypothetical protein